MRDASRNLYERYEPIRRRVEVGFWIVFMALQALFNTTVALVDARDRAVPRAGWEIVTWELSSHLVLLALVPAVVALQRRLAPLARTRLLHYLAWHLAGSVVFSLVHVAAMFALRALVYAAAGEHYDFAGWTGRWGYEYLKDVRAYLAMVFGIWVYGVFMLRLQGEARVLDPPEGAPSVPPSAPAVPAARPERFLVRKLRREFLIAAGDIDWLQAQGNYVGLHVNGHDYLLRATLTDFLAQLDPALFVRVHRSHAVNVSRVKEIEPLDGGDARLHMQDGSTVPCSRRYRDALRGTAA